MAQSGTFAAPTRDAVIDALLQSRTIVDAARTSGIPRSTIYRWLKDSQFAEELESRQAALLSSAHRRLSVIAVDAVGCLADMLNLPPSMDADQARSASIRLKAATSILDTLAKHVETTGRLRVVEIEGRLSRLEGNRPWKN